MCSLYYGNYLWLLRSQERAGVSVIILQETHFQEQQAWWGLLCERDRECPNKLDQVFSLPIEVVAFSKISLIKSVYYVQCNFWQAPFGQVPAELNRWLSFRAPKNSSNQNYYCQSINSTKCIFRIYTRNPHNIAIAEKGSSSARRLLMGCGPPQSCISQATRSYDDRRHISHFQ